MRISIVFVFGISLSLLAAPAFSADRPVVAVLGLGAPPGIRADYKKEFNELTQRLNSEVRKSLRACRVVPSKRTAALLKRYNRRLRKCEEKCDLEFGRLINADYLVSGKVLSADTNGLEASLRLQDVEKEAVLAETRVRQDDFASLADTLIKVLPRVLAPLYRWALQEADDEEVAEIEPEEPERTIEVANTEEERVTSDFTPDIWQRAEQKPRFAPGEHDIFGGAGVNAGYSFVVGRGSSLNEAYTPVIHVGVELFFHPFAFLQIGLAGDFDFMAGNVFYTNELVKKDYALQYEYDPEIYDMGLGGDISSYVNWGLRPTVRLDFQIDAIEILAGFGMGIRYFVTSGEWFKYAEGSYAPRLPEGRTGRETGTQEAYYEFSQASYGFYAVAEVGGFYRIQDDRFGLGFRVQYALYGLGSAGSRPNVRHVYKDTPIEEEYMFDASASNYLNTFVRHLGSLDLLTLVLCADMRF